MSAWPRVTLGSVASLSLGKMLDAKKNRGRMLPYVRNPDVRWFSVDTSNLKSMPFEPHEDERFGLRSGDVLVCEGGDAGRAAIWQGQVAEAKFQKAIHRVRVGPDLYNRFLVHQLLADHQSGRLSDYYTGATIKHLTGQDLARYEFRLPPLRDQRRIADILDRADAMRAKRREAIALCDSLKRVLFIETFGDPAATARWPMGSLGDLIESASYGTSEKSEPHGSIAVLRMGNVTSDGEMDFEDLKFMDLDDHLMERYTVRDGDVLFNRTNSRDLVGKTAVYRGEQPMAYAGYLIRVRTNHRAEPDYVASYLNSSHGKATLRAMCKSIVGMANINATELRSIRIALPPVGLQRRFSRQLASVAALKSAHLLALAELGTLFASLQYRAFRGEV